MAQDKKVNDLLSQMRTAVDTARAVTAAAPPPTFTAQPLQPAFSKVDEPSQSRALLLLINELMAGVETRFGIKPGTLVERKLVRIFKDMPMATLKDWVESMNSCSPEHSEWQSLVENLTVHETYFCRDPDLMSMLADEILPHLLNLMDVPDKDDIIKAIQAAQGHETPEQIQSRIDKAVDEALMKAQHDLKSRELDLKYNPERERAEIRKLVADTMLTTIQAAFSAMQAAGQITAVPAIAPMMWTPSTRSVAASAMIFTNPSGS